MVEVVLLVVAVVVYFCGEWNSFVSIMLKHKLDYNMLCYYKSIIIVIIVITVVVIVVVVIIIIIIIISSSSSSRSCMILLWVQLLLCQ